MKKKFWSKNIAIRIAHYYNIKLNYDHWIIIYYFRFFYFKYGNLPNVRNLLNFLNKNYDKKYDSIYIYKLFPKGIIRQVSEIACLPNNVQCF